MKKFTTYLNDFSFDDLVAFWNEYNDIIEIENGETKIILAVTFATGGEFELTDVIVR